MRFARFASATVALLVAASASNAGIVTWDVDPAASYVRLNIPDVATTLEGTAVTVRVRNADNSNWSDAGGRRAFYDGTIVTNYVDGSTIQFLTGQHNLFALNSGNFRPNPAAFNPLNTNAQNPDGQYSNTTTAPAPYGAKIRGNAFGIINVDIGFLSIDDVFLDISSGVIGLVGGTTIPGSTSNFGIDSANINFDGSNINILVTIPQPIPDILAEPLPPFGGLQTASGSVTNVGLLDRKLTYNVTVPISIDISGQIINGSATGVIVAYATVPEFGSIGLLAMGALVTAAPVLVRRRKRS